MQIISMYIDIYMYDNKDNSVVHYSYDKIYMFLRIREQ